MTRQLALALRNLGRNLRRTLITLVAIGLGLGLMVVGVVLQAGQHDDMRRTAVATLAGSVVVQHPQWQEEREPALLVAGASQIAEGLRKEYPSATVTSRLLLDGLLTSANGSVAAGVSCVDPASEALVQQIDDRLVAGEWLDPADDRGIVIGRAMADALSVDVGDKVVLMGQFGQEEMQSRLFRVKGIFRMGAAEMDAFAAWAPLAAGQELVGKPDTANQIALHLTGADDEAAAAAAARRLAGADAAVLTSREALPEIWALLEIDARSNDVIMAIFGVIVAMGVLNTVLMSVMERQREFGVLMAVGMRPARLARLVLLESLLLGLLGAGLGLALGCALAWPLVTTGLDYTQMVGESFDTAGVVVSGVIKGRYAWDRLGVYAAGAVLFTVGAALWPALHVTRLTPLDAMRKT